MRSRGRSTSARASAIRCCSPSDVSFGYLVRSVGQPERPDQVVDQGTALSEHAGHPGGILHVLLRGELLHQTETLRHHRDVRPTRRRRPPACRRSPSSGDSQPAATFNRVVLPDPERPTRPTTSPARAARLTLGARARPRRPSPYVLSTSDQPHDRLLVEPPGRAVGIRPPQLRRRRDVRRMCRIVRRPRGRDRVPARTVRRPPPSPPGRASPTGTSLLQRRAPAPGPAPLRSTRHRAPRWARPRR